MTPKENKFLVSQLVITYRLFLTLLLLSQTLPILARKNFLNDTTNSTLVIMSNATNVTAINKSFNDFKKMFGVEFTDDRRVTFTSGRGELINFLSLLFRFLLHCTLAPPTFSYLLACIEAKEISINLILSGHVV
jgi:hypothetical protein